MSRQYLVCLVDGILLLLLGAADDDNDTTWALMIIYFPYVWEGGA